MSKVPKAARMIPLLVLNFFIQTREGTVISILEIIITANPVARVINPKKVIINKLF